MRLPATSSSTWSRTSQRERAAVEQASNVYEVIAKASGVSRHLFFFRCYCFPTPLQVIFSLKSLLLAETPARAPAKTNPGAFVTIGLDRCSASYIVGDVQIAQLLGVLAKLGQMRSTLFACNRSSALSRHISLDADDRLTERYVVGDVQRNQTAQASIARQAFQQQPERNLSKAANERTSERQCFANIMPSPADFPLAFPLMPSNNNVSKLVRTRCYSQAEKPTTTKIMAQTSRCMSRDEQVQRMRP